MGRKDKHFDQQEKRKDCVISVSSTHLISHDSTDEFYGGSAFGEGGLESLSHDSTDEFYGGSAFGEGGLESLDTFFYFGRKKMGKRGARLYTLGL